MFREPKTAQMAAFFTQKQGGQIAVLKLMKLLYLADREALDQFGWPITGDKPVSMPHGPVLSMTYSLIAEGGEAVKDGWEAWITDRDNHQVSVKREVNRSALNELSDAELDILEKVWQLFGKMNQWQIRDYTHDHCAEWKDPNGSSRPIEFADIFRALGRSPEAANELAAQLQADVSASRFLASL